MGIFGATPPKRVTPLELHNHVVGALRTGEHRLSQGQADHFHSVIQGYMDSDSYRFKNSPGLTKKELPEFLSALKSEQHSSHGNHLSDHQISKVEHVLNRYIDKHMSY